MTALAWPTKQIEQIQPMRGPSPVSFALHLATMTDQIVKSLGIPKHIMEASTSNAPPAASPELTRTAATPPAATEPEATRPTLREKIILWQISQPGRAREILFSDIHRETFKRACSIFWKIDKRRYVADRDAAWSMINFCILKAAAEYRGRSDFRTMLYSSIRNSIIDATRTEQRRKRSSGRQDISIESVAGLLTVEEDKDRRLVQRDHFNHWRRIAKCLTREEAHVYRRRHAMGWEYKKIGKSLDRYFPRQRGKWSLKMIERRLKIATAKISALKNSSDPTLRIILTEAQYGCRCRAPRLNLSRRI